LIPQIDTMYLSAVSFFMGFSLLRMKQVSQKRNEPSETINRLDE
jgi:hypothetical protein